jgi:hypothetical protein
MSDPLPNLDFPPTEVRFSIRSLLIWTVVVATLATVAHFLLQRYDRDAQLRMFAYWASALVVVIFALGYFAIARFRAEQKAGRVLFTFVPHSYFFPHWPRFAAAFCGSLLLLMLVPLWFAGTYQAAQSNSVLEALGKSWQPLASMSLWGWSCFAGITYLWWGRKIQFCQHGIVVRHQFLPWEMIHRHYWDACTKNARVLETQVGRFRRIAVIVPPEKREAVEAALKEKANRN